MKKVLIFLAGGICAVILLILAVVIVFDDDECCDNMEQTENYDASQTPASEFYGSGSDNSSASDDTDAADDTSSNERSDNASNASDGKVIHITSKQFRQLVADYKTDKGSYIGSKPCIVDFFAEWCGPCKQLSPILDKMAAKYADKIIIYKVDIDEEPQVAQAYGIESIPTLFFCSNGSMNVTVGAPSQNELEDIIKSL